MNKRKPLTLIAVGIFLISITLISSQLGFIPDFIKSLLMGTGIGIEILALIKGRRKAV